MDLALILPTFNAQDFIRENLTLLDSFLAPRFERYEIVVVDDGSTDGTSQTVRTLGLSNVRLLTLEKNQGKYSALKLGMLDSKAKFKLFTDVDLPYDLAAIPYMVKLLEEQKFHLVVGDRSLVNSVCDKSTGPLRQLTHHLLQTMLRLVYLSHMYDSQCGLKGFRGEVANELFSLVRDGGFAGDIEILYVALKYNLDIKRIPVRMRGSSLSTVNVAMTIMCILKRVFLLKPCWQLGFYDSDVLRAMGAPAYWASEADSR